MAEQRIYHVCQRSEWQASRAAGRYAGSAQDKADGFIHFSTSTQVAATAARHFAGQGDLLLVAIEAAGLGDALRWEVSRGGELFPHLHGDLPLSAVAWVKPLALDGDGRHDFSGLLP